MFIANGWYMLSSRPDAFRDCGLHGLLSARKRQLTYSFCYAQEFIVLYFLFVIY